jgi:lipopolysaccharide transport system ATP-binding protein
VGSLLEVGTGFHPELTGRENIYLNGAILGMKRAEIEHKFDEILAFAEVERFIDTPVKHYSSGMYLRLAFAVAAHLEPEILLVDEVLAVGDAAFQKKCLNKMGDVAQEGRTVLFVSHNMAAVQSLCERALWLSAGHLQEDGVCHSIVSQYLCTGSETRAESFWPDPHSAPGNHLVRLRSVQVNRDGQDGDGPITVKTPVRIEITYWNRVPGSTLNVSLVLHNAQDVCVFNAVSEAVPRPAALLRHTCWIPADLLNDGAYRLRVLIVKDTSRAILDLANAASFEVQDTMREGNWYGKWLGVVRPALAWRTEVLELPSRGRSGDLRAW